PRECVLARLAAWSEGYKTQVSRQKIKVRAKIGRTIAKNYGRSFRNFSKSKDKPTTAYSILLG
ncbi:hypothetical protein MMJ10_11360, partial [Enterococcus cecorum]|nr:hypothetical protein [Enterococcus cecorum]